MLTSECDYYRSGSWQGGLRITIVGSRAFRGLGAFSFIGHTLVEVNLLRLVSIPQVSPDSVT